MKWENNNANLLREESQSGGELQKMVVEVGLVLSYISEMKCNQ